MTKKELKYVSKMLSPKIGLKFNLLEKEMDVYFLKNKKIPIFQYKIIKKIMLNILINEMPKRMAEEIEKYNYFQFEKFKIKSLK